MRNLFDINLGTPYTPRPMRRLGVLMTALLLSGNALAQGEEEKEPPPSATKEEPKGEIESVIAADSAKLTPDEKKRRTETMLQEMRDALQRATDILAEARAAKDIVQLNCVNEKLTQIKGLLRISEQASVKMYEALASNQDDVVNHEFTKMAVAHQKVLILRAEADQCVGESTIYAGETEVEVEVAPEIREGDPTETEPPPIAPGVPPVASEL